MMGTKKDVGVKFLSALIPIIRPSHCPFMKISNRKSAHAEWYTNPLRPDTPRRIYTKTHSTTEGELHLINIYKGYRTRGNIKLTHANVSVALHLHEESNLRSLMIQTVTLRKRPFETGRTTGLRSLPSMSNITSHPHSGGLLGANLHIFF